MIGALTGSGRYRRVKCPFVARLHFAFQSRTKLHLVTDFVKGRPLFETLAVQRTPKAPKGPQRPLALASVPLALGFGHFHPHSLAAMLIGQRAAVSQAQSRPAGPVQREARARFYAAEVVLALEHLHTNGVLHINLKPSNVLLDPTGLCRQTVSETTTVFVIETAVC